jgi:Fur family ferric uptake transcriptional regulator
VTPTETAELLREHDLRATRQRLAVLDALAEAPHAGADTVLAIVRARAGSPQAVSTQAVYDTLHTLTRRGIVRRFQPAGSVARYELRVGDNHHHVVCRRCGDVSDIDCATGPAPCLEPSGLASSVPGFVVDEAEVTYWGECATCAAAEERRPTDDAPEHEPQHATDNDARAGGSA